MADGGTTGDLAIRGVVEYILKGKGLEDAVKRLDKLEKAAEKADSTQKKQAASFQKLGDELKKYVGGAMLINLAKQSLEVFAAYERQLTAISQQTRSFGGDGKKAARDTREFLAALERVTGSLA